MYNFEHEVTKIRDRYLKYFFLWDYFHDGCIHNIKILEDESIELTISSNREWGNDYNLSGGYTSETNGYDEFIKHIFDEKYLYKCTFKSCKYFNSEVQDNGYIYLNGRFKNSAIVGKVNNISKNKYYHLRMQTTGGYIDIVFSQFNINKIIGDIELPKKIEDTKPFVIAVAKFGDINIDIVRETALSEDFANNYFAFQYLAYIKDESVVDIAIKKLHDEDLDITAIWALGEYGSENVLSNLFEKWSKAEGIYRRHIQDAIEKIIYRTNSIK